MHSVINSRDHMCKENYLYFMSADGKQPCDNGSKDLEERKLIAKVNNAQTGKVTITKKGNKIHFALICKNKTNDKITKETLHQLSISLREALTDIPIRILSITKTPEIDNFKWNIIFDYIRKSLIGFPIKLIVCHGIVKTPDIEKRKSIIEESHSSIVGGHKGVTKTYNRIRQNFYWENLKLEFRITSTIAYNASNKKISSRQNEITNVDNRYSTFCFREGFNGYSRTITNNLPTKFLYIDYSRPFN